MFLYLHRNFANYYIYVYQRLYDHSLVRIEIRPLFLVFFGNVGFTYFYPGNPQIFSCCQVILLINMLLGFYRDLFFSHAKKTLICDFLKFLVPSDAESSAKQDALDILLSRASRLELAAGLVSVAFYWIDVFFLFSSFYLH